MCPYLMCDLGNQRLTISYKTAIWRQPIPNEYDDDDSDQTIVELCSYFEYNTQIAIAQFKKKTNKQTILPQFVH